MPTYEFEAPDGTIVERYYSMSEVPSVGEDIGEGLVRVVSRPRVQPTYDRRFVSHSLPKNWPYAKDHDEQGRCRFHNASDVKEAVARSQDAEHPADRVTYDE